MLHGLSEAQGWSMNKIMACSKERTMERHYLTLYARMQPKFARWRAQIWPHQRHPHAGRRSLNTERAAIVQGRPQKVAGEGSELVYTGSE